MHVLGMLGCRGLGNQIGKSHAIKVKFTYGPT